MTSPILWTLYLSDFKLILDATADDPRWRTEEDECTLEMGLPIFCFGNDAVTIVKTTKYVRLNLNSTKRNIFDNHYSKKTSKARAIVETLLDLESMVRALPVWEAGDDSIQLSDDGKASWAMDLRYIIHNLLFNIVLPPLSTITLQMVDTIIKSVDPGLPRDRRVIAIAVQPHSNAVIGLHVKALSPPPTTRRRQGFVEDEDFKVVASLPTVEEEEEEEEEAVEED
ncbi:hypothetical protein DFH08DRAFT_826423 [Mycena albidolilacea]|uniref:Uncharacterized protein n=1 Tax=Mycena albidolilacea TaxID=1033008 RepID=A0AAD7E8F0_9AGAR|nr:hypothetical protein DFH08DRAFT_826423 [Mycena albidolilacea]